MRSKVQKGLEHALGSLSYLEGTLLFCPRDHTAYGPLLGPDNLGLHLGQLRLLPVTVKGSVGGFRSLASPALGVWQNPDDFRFEESGPVPQGTPFLPLAAEHTREFVSSGTTRKVIAFVSLGSVAMFTNDSEIRP